MKSGNKIYSILYYFFTGLKLSQEIAINRIKIGLMTAFNKDSSI
jgi:hypothetical protein